jgi:hypothetical protein
VTGGDASAADSGQDSSQGGGVVCKQVDGGCASLLNCSKEVPIVQVAQTAPTATGGVVTQGVYYLVGYTLFTGPNGATGTAGWYLDTQQIGMPSTGADGGDGGAGPDSSAAGLEASVADAEEGSTEDGGEENEDAEAAEGGADADAGPQEQQLPWLDVSQNDSSSLNTFAGMIIFSPPNNVSFTYACPSGNADFGATYSASATQIQYYYPGPGDQGTVQVTYKLL